VAYWAHIALFDQTDSSDKICYNGTYPDRINADISQTERWLLSLFDCPRGVFGLFSQPLHLGEGHLGRYLTPDGVAGELVQPIHNGCNQRILGEYRSGISDIYGHTIRKLLLVFIYRLKSGVIPLVCGRNNSFTGK
jgi:hypothetical protein